MCEREDSDEELSARLMFNGEEVNVENESPAPSHPNDESLTQRNEQPSGRSVPPHRFFLPLAEAFASPTPHRLLPSSVASTPPAGTATWCPSPSLYSAFRPYRFPDARTGIALRMADPSSYLRYGLMLQSSLSLRPETPSTSSSLATAAERQKKYTQEASELCAAVERPSFNISEPVSQESCDTGEMDEGAAFLTAAAGDSIQHNYYPNNSATPGNKDNSAAEDKEEEDDDDDDREHSPATPSILLRESSEDAGISKQLARSTAVSVDLSSVQEDNGDLGLFLPEGYAVGIPMNCLKDSEKAILLGHSQLHCGTSPDSLSSVQFDAGSLNTPSSTLLNASASAQMNSAAVGEAAPPDIGQSSEADSDLEWGSCKICWLRWWKVIFIPCGHGSCKPCYKRLIKMTCPFCRKYIREIVEVLLAYNLPLEVT